MNSFQVIYTWSDADGEYQGNTVVSGPDPETSVANFRRRCPHLTDAWIAGSRDRQEESAA